MKRECKKCKGNRGMRGRYPPKDGLCVSCRSDAVKLSVKIRAGMKAAKRAG